jgi:hypothetical protein
MRLIDPLVQVRWRHGAAELLVRDLEACGPLSAVP